MTRKYLFRWLGCVVVVHLLAGACSAADLPAIARGLASDDFAVREAAQKSLDALPADQINALREFVKSEKDPEVQARFAGRIETMAIYLAVHPTPLSIDLENVPLLDIVNALNGQLGGPYLANQTSNARFSIRAREKTFAEIISELSRQNPITISPSGTPMRLTAGVAVQNAAAALRGAVAGMPAAVALGGGTTIRQYEACGGFAVGALIVRQPVQVQGVVVENYAIRVMAISDPRVRIGRYSPVLRITEMADNAGNNFVPLVNPVVDNQMNSLSTPTSGITATATVGVPKVRGTVIEKLKGTMRAMIVVAEDKIVVDGSRSHDGFKLGSSAVKIDMATPAAAKGQSILSLSVSPPALEINAVVRNNVLEMQQDSAFAVSFQLTSGNTVISHGSVNSGTVRISVPPNVAGLKLELSRPSKMQEVQIPVELKGLIVP